MSPTGLFYSVPRLYLSLCGGASKLDLGYLTSWFISILIVDFLFKSLFIQFAGDRVSVVGSSTTRVPPSFAALSFPRTP